MIQLHPYQFKLKSEIYQAWNQGARNELAILPTGGGKSIVVTDIISDQVRQGRAGVVKAHRNELVSQMSLHVARRGIPHRIIGPDAMKRAIIAEHRAEFNGQSFINDSAITTVAGVDTIKARKDSLGDWAAQQEYWITDEAHHVLAQNKWGIVAGMFPNAFGLGVTATPSRADKAGLGRHADGLFDHMSIGPGQRWLIDNGFLTDYEIVAPPASIIMDDDDIGSTGDFTPAKMRKKARESKIVGDVVLEWCKHALGKRTICFATDVETAQKIAQKFVDFGISAIAVSGETDTTVRNEAVRRFRNGSVTVLVNVDLFGEGFDVPACECVIMARPTASLGVYMQQFGRALRTMQGKLFGLIIDMVDNWRLHGLPDTLRAWSLDRQVKKAKKTKDPEEMPLKRCDSEVCGKLYLRFLPCCPYCGNTPVPAGRGGIEEIDGDLVLLDRAELARLREEMELESAADVANRAGHVVGPLAAAGAANRQIEKITAQQRLIEVIEQWAGIQRAKGRSDQESYKRFHYATGVNVLTACGKHNTRQDFESMTMRVQDWIDNALFN